jgi:tetratricopeptide (TPR) repeat protein
MAKRVRPHSASSDRKPRHPAPRATRKDALPPPVVRLPPPGPSVEALSLFEKGMHALQEHAYSDAAERFRALLADFPAEGALRERSQVYLALCERELGRRPAAPRTIEERLTAATAALNDGDEPLAERLARAVLADAPQQDLALYLLAAVQARRNDAEGALHLLERAIAVNPEIRAQARHDADFEGLRALEVFRQLIETPANHTTNSHRRPRRGRTGT